MELTKIIVIIAVIFTITIALAMTNIGVAEEKPPFDLQIDDSPPKDQPRQEPELLLPSKRVSRFLQEKSNNRNPHAADHCHKDNEICGYVHDGHGRRYNTTCCNNKCMNLAEDPHNCGACKKKCKYTKTCCRGHCVDIAFDERHCGRCNNACKHRDYCVYGMCNYA